jgi:uncharacterized Ntn-hydrolase superfamily protein
MTHAQLAFAALAAALTLAPAADAADDYDLDATGTFSIVARDPATGELGMGVQSKSLGVGSRTITVVGGLAAIAHQATSNPIYGVLGIDLLRAGMTPQQALDVVVRGDEGRESRQVGIIDIQGRTASWTGKSPQDWKGHRCGVDYCAQGNILVGPEVVEAIARAFESSKGPLAERMLAALDAAQAAGGDARGRQSAALVVAKPLAGAAGFGDRPVDFRVDDHREPLVELRRLLNLLRSGQLVTEANAKLRAGDVASATDVALAATVKAADNDNAWVTLAMVHARAGRKEAALEAMRRSIALNPANRRQLPLNPAFKAFADDPDFRRVIEPLMQP